jgi:hypothetical protein
MILQGCRRIRTTENFTSSLKLFIRLYGFVFRKPVAHSIFCPANLASIFARVLPQHFCRSDFEERGFDPATGHATRNRRTTCHAVG